MQFLPNLLEGRRGLVVGIAHFDALIDQAPARAPKHRLVTLEEVGAVAAALVSGGASGVTGNIAYVDAGYHVMS